MKIGITGQSGFIGSHLFNFLNLKENIQLIPFSKEFYTVKNDMEVFVKECDVIVHLAAMNRYEDPQVIYDTNIKLVDLLIDACTSSNSRPHILFSSSTQEGQENLYGHSKKEGRLKLEAWAEENNARTTGMIIPNVFGPFGKPFYNSFIATFCHLVANNERPNIDKDAIVNLIYVNELIEEIYLLIMKPLNGMVEIPSYHKIKVSNVLKKLDEYFDQYLKNGIFPNLQTPFDLALFNTFRCYIPTDYYPRAYSKHTDERGSFVEIVRANTSGQFSFSTTVPGVTRGNHFHTRKAERFAVIKGKAKISLRKIDTDEVTDYILDGESPGYVDMPIWHTHNITNIGEDELITLFWINEPYNQEDSDTYFVNV